MDFDLDILNSLTNNNRLAPVQEVPETEELLKAIEFPMIGQSHLHIYPISNTKCPNYLASIDTSTMQDIMNSNSAAQQSVIQTISTPMNQQSSSSGNQLMFTATIFTQDMSQAGGSSGAQQVLSQANESSSMMSDLSSFMSNEMEMSQQASSNEQMMAPPLEVDDKDSFKGKHQRVHWKAQLP
jgi:hypothetical protein